MTRAEYLSLTLQLGITVREAMQMEIGTVNAICRVREKQQEEAKHRGGRDAGY